MAKKLENKWWYVSSLATFVMVEATDNVTAKVLGQDQLSGWFNGDAIKARTVRLATKQEIELHLATDRWATLDMVLAIRRLQGVKNAHFKEWFTSRSIVIEVLHYCDSRDQTILVNEQEVKQFIHENFGSGNP